MNYLLAISVLNYTAPPAPERIIQYMPEETESFGHALWKITSDVMNTIAPSLTSAGAMCCGIIAMMILLSIAKRFSNSISQTIDDVGTIAVATVLLRTGDTLLMLGIETVKEISEYGNLLIPVLTGALAAQGGVSASASLYAGTAFFSTILSFAVSNLLRPLFFVYILLAVAHAATGEKILAKFINFTKWLTTWAIKLTIYIFTGYMGITRVVSGSTDAAKLKAAKLTISGMVPVVGGILSEASESVLVGAGLVKNSVGIYGLFVIFALWLEPFLSIGAQYLLLKATAGVCDVFECDKVTGLIKNFTTAMAFVLAVIATQCLLLLISIVCFMKGVL